MLKYMFKGLTLFTALLLSTPVFAHTINHNMEQMYGTAYLPLFIGARLLPFFGLGLLAYDKSKSGFFQVRLPFFLTLLLGIILGFIWHGGQFVSMINTVGIIVIGGFLLFANGNSDKYFLQLIAVLGLTIGYENGLFVAHSHDYRWMYLLILGSGVIIFLILSNVHFIGNSKRKVILNIGGVVFIILGIFFFFFA